MTTRATPYLGAALHAAAAIRTYARDTVQGLSWLPDPDQPDKAATISAPGTIYSGDAGIILFLLELAAATGDSAYFSDAHRGAIHLSATWRDVLTHKGLFSFPKSSLDFQTGIAGTAFTLAHAAAATRDASLETTARELVDFLVSQATPAGAGIDWIGAPTVGFGDGGITLFLLWAAKRFQQPSYREVAIRAGTRILETAIPDARGGIKWIHPLLQQLIPIEGLYMPNFELGTAGVAYVLARLYEETGQEEFLTGARQGADHIRAIATVKDDAALLFYREPDLTDLYYLGYCHGPVGTARLFHQLSKLDGDPTETSWRDRFARGITASGAPEHETPGLWNVVCQCCGTAGVADFFTSLAVATGDPAHLAVARRAADVTLAREGNGEHAGRWYQAWTRVEPDNLAAENGYMIGAAGVGSAMLHLHLAEQGGYRAILFPDNPFPEAGMA